MDSFDMLKTVFVTDWGIFAYKKMSFGLKNAGATYQHLVDHVFRHQIGRNDLIYVDDIFIKSKIPSDFPKDLIETLEMPRVGLKLNPSKCSFGVQTEKFLGYRISHLGLGVNPNKVKVVREMRFLRTL